MALDLLEAVRPSVDAYLLALIGERTLRPRDFGETRKGVCRLSQTLARDLTETLGDWRERIAPVVEGAAGLLANGELPTRLTHRNRIKAWDGRRSGSTARRRTPKLPKGCRDCGAPLPDRRRRYCDECRVTHLVEGGAAARESAAAVLAQLRADGRDPRHGGKAAVLRGRKNAGHQQAIKEWRGRAPDPARFEREILPALRSAPIGDLIAATGLSKHYCSLIRLGKRVPHARHWDALAAVVSAAD